MDIIFHAQKDVRLVPFSPLTPSDDLEVRLQFPPQQPQTGMLRVYHGSELWYETALETLQEGYASVRFRHSVAHLRGPQALHVTYNDQPIGTIGFTVEPPSNTVDGGFVILGGAENASVTKIFGDRIPALDDSGWKTLMNEYNELGFRCIIVQMTVGIIDFDSNTLGAYYDSALFPRAQLGAKDPIAAILEQCQKNGQTVFIGMCSPLFKGDVALTGKLMRELYERYGDYTSFYGWYSSWEFGLPNAPDDDFRLSVQCSDIQALRELADELAPAMPILYSPFTTSYTKEGLHDMGVAPGVLEGIADGSLPFDILAPHDHCGQVHKLSNQQMVRLEDAVKIFASLKRACDLGGVHLWANCEGFNFTYEESNSEAGFYRRNNLFAPRHIGGSIDGQSGLVAHTALLKPYTEKIISFMLLGLFQKPDSPVQVGNELCRENYRLYSAYLNAPAYTYKNLALDKPYTIQATQPLLEPDNGHLFYNEFVCGAEQVLHPRKNGGGLLTDGVMSGAQPHGFDSYLSTGCLLEHYGDSCQCQVVIDLEQPCTVDRIRCFTAHNHEFNADRILAEYSNDGSLWSYFGENDGSFINGWAELPATRKVHGRYVRLTYFKTNQTNWRSWLILEDIEVQQLWKGEAQ